MTVVDPEKIHITASILAADFADLGDAVRAAEAGGANSIHIDMMDGHYVPNITFGLDLIPALKKRTSLPLVPHLELENPDDLIDSLARLGSDMIVVQEDTCPDLGQTLARIRSYGIAAGVGVNPGRPLETVLPFLDQVDLLIVMSVNPGFGGQAFDPHVLSKVEAARRYVDEHALDVRVGIDGGVNEQTIGDVLRAGADYLVIGSAIFSRGDIVQAIVRMRNAIRESLRMAACT